MKNIAINLVPISKGGGLQNALSFILWLKKQPPISFTPIILCQSNSIIEETVKNSNIKYIAIRNTFKSRLIFEFFLARKIMKQQKVKLVFTLFGPPPFSTPANVTKISGFAYSNLLQPEVDFWGFLPPHKKLLKNLIDFFRFHQSANSDVIILETDYLKRRAFETKFAMKEIHVVKMAPGQAVLDSISVNTEATSNVEFIDIAYISGAHPNKRIHLLVNIFAALNKDNNSNLKFRLVTTLPEKSDYLLNIQQEFNRLGANEYHKNIGSIEPAKVGDVLMTVDGIINIALLESFSNNWVEAWAAQLPLITTDADWARHSCESAAIYIDPNNADDAAEKIFSLYKSGAHKKDIVAEGTRMLNSLPTPQEKYLKFIQIINNSLKVTNEI